MAYQKITDLFVVTSTDYNPKAEETIKLFKIVQNKFHYTAHGNTAAEIIYNRPIQTSHLWALPILKVNYQALRYRNC